MITDVVDKLRINVVIRNRKRKGRNPTLNQEINQAINETIKHRLSFATQDFEV